MLCAVAGALLLSLKKGGAPSGDLRLALKPASAPAEALPADQAYRERRRETRQREQAALEAMIAGESTDPETRALAAEMLRDLVRNDETELAVEAALAARGWTDALCVARQGEAAVLLSHALTEQEANLILEIARTASGNDGEIIRVIGF